MERLRRFFIGLYWFFPIYLLILHLRRSLLLILFWIILFAMVGGSLFGSLGIPFLFQTPEYLDSVGPLSYFITGGVVGLFIMAFHISSYIFYSFRFPFLATLARPLYRFSVNNSIIPVSFLLYYSYIIWVRGPAEGFSHQELFFFIVSLNAGVALMLFVVFTYFFGTLKKTALDTVSEKLEKSFFTFWRKKANAQLDLDQDHRVQIYLKNFYSLRRARDSKHYSKIEIGETLQQHHNQAGIFFILLILLFISLSLASDNPIFRIPAGASIVLLMTVYLLVTGALFSWFKTWTYTVGVLALIGFNYFSGIPVLQKTHYAYGLNYKTDPAPYTFENLKKLSSQDNIEADRKEMLRQLNQWRAKFPKGKNPKMVIVNSSGGGLRSSLWTYGVLQKADSLMGGDLLKNTFMMTGSSGGMVGAAFYREMVYRKKQNDHNALLMHKPLINLGKDVLNPVGFGMVVNDLFVNFETVSLSGQKYPRDRGFAFDQKLNENTEHFFDRRLVEYKELEKSGQMPVLILAPTIISDGRRLLISPQGLSFLTKVENPQLPESPLTYDAVELSKMFVHQQADSLRFATALRMSATFPYITPLVTLPSNPPIEVIDAGARDNDGFELSLRFLFQFKDWISNNTSGVVFVKMLANRPQKDELTGSPYTTRLDALVKPVGGVVTSFANWQGFSENEVSMYSQSWIKFNVEVVNFSLLSIEDDLSLSWHLTESEKKRINHSLDSERIQLKLDEFIDKVR